VISNSTDPTYDNPPAATWSSVESTVGIICACLPSLRPVMQRAFPRLFSFTGSSRGTRTLGASRGLGKTSTRLSCLKPRASSTNDYLVLETQNGSTKREYDVETQPTGGHSRSATALAGTITSKVECGDSSSNGRSSDDSARAKEISIVTVVQQTSEPGPAHTLSSSP
jgi:hypothetical protein